MMVRISAALVVALTGAAAFERGAYAQDTGTQGDWVGVYGSDGYILANFNGDDLTALPDYIASATWAGESRHTWADPSTEAKAVESPDEAIRKATAVFSGSSFTLTLDVDEPAEFQLGIYSLDWDGLGTRNQRIDVTVGGTEAGGNSLSFFQDGIWTLYDIDADSAMDDVVVTITNNPGSLNAVVSAIMFDPAPVPEPASLGLLGIGGLALLRRRRL